MLVCGIKQRKSSMQEKTEKKIPNLVIKSILAIYAVILLTLILLAASNYPVQWRHQANEERYRYLEVIAQSIDYHVQDHEGVVFDVPSGPVMIANTNDCTMECPALDRSLPCYNLEAVLVPDYVSALPQEPFVLSDVSTGFYLRYEHDLLTLGACHQYFQDPIILRQELK